ncbi:MAG: hypothetical protein JWQ04_2140 [Pedosphaera sp.]|nr:hypothetical protein [Pedosphaera sp.]
MSLLNSIPDAVIEDKERLEEEFLAFLHRLDYPADSIFRGPAFEFKFRRKWRELFRLWAVKITGRAPAQSFSCYADLAILELGTSQYAALIEFRLRLDEQVESRLATVFQAVLDCVQTRPAAFLVLPGRDADFHIFQLRDEGRWQELPHRHFPHYSALVAGFAAGKTLNREFNQARNLHRLALTCRVLALAVGILTLSSILGLSSLTIGQISLFILAALLLVVPEAIRFRLTTAGGGKPKLVRVK